MQTRRALGWTENGPMSRCWMSTSSDPSDDHGPVVSCCIPESLLFQLKFQVLLIQWLALAHGQDEHRDQGTPLVLMKGLRRTHSIWCQEEIRGITYQRISMNQGS